MINTLNLIDALPNIIEIGGNSYALVIYPNFEESLCIAYQDLNGENEKIFVIVIEPGIAHKDDDLEYIEDMYELHTVSNSITAFNLLYKSLIYNEIIEENPTDPFDYEAVEGFEELDLDLEEEEALGNVIDLTEDDYIKIVNQDFVNSELVDSDEIESTDVRKSIRYVKAVIEPISFETSYINGKKDSNKNTKMPGIYENEDGKKLSIEIDLETGKVINWPNGTYAQMSYKVGDYGEYTMYDKDWKRLCVYEGYVPELFQLEEKEKNGDWFSIKIGKDGKIKNFPTGADLQLMTNDLMFDGFITTEQYC